MMRKMLKKELFLALHPTSLIFLCFSAMLLIPSYPYYVAFFYTCLGIFFLFLTGRENRDIYYMLTLPVKKRDVVKARTIFIVLIELSQFVSGIPFMYVQSYIIKGSNPAGLAANTALFGSVFIMYGIFNWFFLTRVYRNTEKVGRAFLFGTLFMTIYIIAAEVCVFAVPFVRDKIDTPDPQYLGLKLIILAAGALIYTGLTIDACRRAEKSFEKLDF